MSRFARVCAATMISLAFSASVQAQSVPTTAGTRASAGSYSFSVAEGAIFAGGTIVTDVTGHAIDISGSVNGADAITGLSSYAGADNDLYSTGSWVTFGGLSFSTATLGDFNLYNSGQGYYGLLSSVTNSGGYADGRVATANVAPVPEPATWVMMIVGFAVVGYGTRRRTRAVAMQAA